MLASFDEATPPAFVGFNGAEGTTVENGPAGGSGKALKILRLGGDVFAGAFVTTSAIPFAANRRTITARVYSPAAGIPMVLKVEDASGAASAEIAATPAVVAGWQTLTWVVTGLDLTKNYVKVVLLPRLGTVDPAPGVSYYFDDITLTTAGAVVPPITSLTFDEANPAYSNLGAFAGALPTVEAGPAGGSGMALKIVKAVNPDTFGGIFFDTAPIGFTNANRLVTARVNSSRAGAVVTLKLEVSASDFVEVLGTATGAANTWSTVTWDFSAVNVSKSYQRMVFVPDNGTVASGQTYWIDNIAVVAGGTPAPAPAPPAAPVTIATLDETTAALVGFEGCFDSTLVSDPAGGTNKVGRVVKPGSGVPFYCGTTVVTVPNGGFTPIPFTNSATTLTVRVYSPDVGIPVRLKVEDIANGAKSVETEAVTTVAGWQTLTFNFANAASGTPVLDLTTTYNKASIFFDFGRIGSGKTYYFDDITFIGGSGNTVLATFDERSFDNTQSQPSVLNGFGGAENSTLVGASDVGVPPDGGRTGKWAKVVKNAGETFAGTSVQRKPNDAVPTMPFATGATKMSVRVYSAYPGIRVHLKVEQSGRPEFNSEVDAFTSLSNTWETLTFDFGPAGKHFVPSGPGPNGYVTDPNSPAYRPTAQLDVSKTYNKVNIFFDYGLGDAGYDAMPGTRTYYFDDVRFVGP